MFEIFCFCDSKSFSSKMLKVSSAQNLKFSQCCRCGALSIGDQILSIDETVIENTALSPDDVMAILDANTSKGYTQIQIMPSHAIIRRGKLYSLNKLILNAKESK